MKPMKTSDLRVRLRACGRSPLQGGKGRHGWVLTFEPLDGQLIEPLMGWTSSRDPLRGLELNFSTREQALAFAHHQGWQVEEVPAHHAKRPTQTYADHFRLDWELLNDFDVAGWPVEATPKGNVIPFPSRQRALPRVASDRPLPLSA